jgi:class 3 adenylate cyclase/predicted ATPase
MDIVVWLRSLGLGKYEAAFRENEIDETVLPSLTHETLKELGVTAVGHRLKLLNAIAALRNDSSGEPPSVHATATSSAQSVTPEDRAERRQVTVMFSDLVGSTALSARMDPEDLREVISAYQKCVAETVQRFGGFVAKYMGDGVLIYFGYPQAHEDDAERAVRAGLKLVAAVGGLKTHPPLQTRMGIATGLVVVGDLIGSGASQEQAIVGETPNLAARLQATAEPNSVVIAESTRKLVGNLFEFEDLGAKDLKGIGGPAQAWAALRPSSVESRFEAMHASGVTELVGREEEIEILLRRWSKIKTGEGQVVLLSGEAGIGKSRLTAALLEQFANEPHTRLRSFCSPQHTDSAFHPIIGQIERSAGLTRNDKPQAKLDNLDAMLAQSSTSTQDAALVADMLSLQNDGRYPVLELTPQQRRQRTLEALVSQVVALSCQKPLLMIFEDAHWTDPTSLELFGLIVDKIPTLRVLLIVTFRPEFEPPWIGRPYVTTLTINRLAQREVDAVIDGVVGNRFIAANIRQDIIERTDGIPLFVEEMTKAVLEAEGEGAAAQAVSMVPSPALAVPASLHASLMARLDRLGAAKEVAQIGAAIGREFSYALLAAVVRASETDLNSALKQLAAAGLLLRQGVPPYATYLFKHALLQDAAYGTLLREPRRALHARIAEALESQFAELTETRPELLARQFTDAGLIEKAASQWGKAGQRSLERSALIEAVAQFTRAVDQVASLPGTPALRREQIKFQVGLANSLYHTKGYSAVETKTTFDQARAMIERAEELGEHIEDPLLLYSVLYGFFIVKFINFDGDAAYPLAQQFLALAEQQKTTAPIMIGHRLLAMTLLCMGDVAEGPSQLDRAWALYDPAVHRPLAARFGHDVGAAALTFRPLALWLLGYPKTALVEADRAIAAARETNHIPTLLFGLACTAFTHICCREHAAASVHTDECIALAREKVAYFRMFAAAQCGCILAETGKSADAIQAISAEIAGLCAIGSTIWGPYFLAHLAVAHAALGKLDEAWRCIGEAVIAIETTKERWYHAEVNRIAGEIALNSPERETAKAETYFERALAVARQQQARSWELRASMSLARLWRDQGKVQQARELLAPVYGWFTEGFDTRDLKEAKALLQELAT